MTAQACGNWIRRYLEFCSGTEAPDMYFVWTGYAVLSSVIGRNIFFRRGRSVHYTNIYVILVGAAGEGKSYAMAIAKRLLEDVENISPRISMSTETPEGWLRYMAGDPSVVPPIPSPVAEIVKHPGGGDIESHPMTIFAGEFIDFIAKAPMDWINTLNHIYDEDFYGYRTKNRGTDRLTGPYIVLVGALPTDISSDLQNNKIITSGFARRTIFQYGDRKIDQPIPIIEYPPEKATLKKELVAYLEELRFVRGEMFWSEESRAFWDEWYRSNSARIADAPHYMTSWLKSKPDQVVKIAMLTSLGESFALELKPSHFQVAIAFFEELEQTLYKIFGGVGRNELAAIADRMFDFIRKSPVPIKKKTVESVFFHECKPPYDFDVCVRHLINSGLILQHIQLTGFSGSEILGTPEVIQAYLKRHTPLNPKSSIPGMVVPAEGATSSA
jgi:hypothetical protein